MISLRGEVEEEDMLYDLPFQRRGRANVSLTNIRTFYKVTVEKHLRDRVEHIILIFMGFPKHIDTIFPVT